MDGGLGFLRSYFASIGVHSKFVSDRYLSDVKYILGNPKLRRLFSTEPPKKKNNENYYPKEKKEIPKGEEQKTESKDGSSTDDQGKSFFIGYQYLITPPLLIGLFLYLLFFDSREQHQDCVTTPEPLKIYKRWNMNNAEGLPPRTTKNDVEEGTQSAEGWPPQTTKNDVEEGTKSG